MRKLIIHIDSSLSNAFVYELLKVFVIFILLFDFDIVFIKNGFHLLYVFHILIIPFIFCPFSQSFSDNDSFTVIFHILFNLFQL